MPNRFEDQVAKFVMRAKTNMDAVVRDTILDVTAAVIDRSPVGAPETWAQPAAAGYVPGHFRASWQYGDSRAPSGDVPGFDTSAGTSNTSYQRIKAALPRDLAGRVHYVVTNAPYGSRLEYGWSKQAPAGFVGLTALEFQNRASMIAARYK